MKQLLKAWSNKQREWTQRSTLNWWITFVVLIVPMYILLLCVLLVNIAGGVWKLLVEASDAHADFVEDMKTTYKQVKEKKCE